jgi:NDP-sugar pyrophosphorylase family protein
MFLPNEFFELSNPVFTPLFNPDKFVWTPLILLEAYLKSQKLGKIDVDIPAGVHLVDPHLISIGKGTVIEPGAYIIGPCVIGENCVVRHGAYIRGNLLAGNGCVIGHDTEVKNSIFLDKAHAPHFSYIGDSILGSGVNMGAGSICSNLKLDNKNVFVYYKGERIDTGMRKFGAIIGDNTRIGCNVVLNPGTILGKHVLCHPNLTVGGYITPNSLIKAESKYFVVPLKQM